MHTSTIRIAYATEDDNYACGKDTGSGAKYACNPFIAGDVAALTVMNAPYSSKPQLGIPKVLRKKTRPVGRSANYVRTLDVGYEYGEFTYTQAITNQTWIQAAIAATSGAIPTSYIFHFEIPGENGAIDYFDLCGCVLKKYELKTNEGDWPTETLTFLYYDLVNSVAVTNLAEVDGSQPATMKDIVFTMDADVVDVYSLNLTIDNELLDKKISGKHQRQDPELQYRDITGDAEFKTDSAEIIGDSLARAGTLTAINPITLIFSTDASTHALTMTNMYCRTDNLGEIPDTTETVMFKTEFDQAGDCGITYA